MFEYFIIVLGILIPFLSEFFESEKKEGESTIFKKITRVKTIMLALGLIVSFIGVTLTKNKENEANKEINEKAKKDSLILVNKNKSDSLRFMVIINELNKAQLAVVEKTNNIVEVTKNESARHLNESRKLKYPIPDEINMTCQTELVLSKKESEDCYNLIKKNNEKRIFGKYDFETHTQNDALILFSDEIFNDTSNTILKGLKHLTEHYLTSFRGSFKNKNYVTILRISNQNSTHKKNLINVYYSILKKQFIITITSPSIKILKSTYISSIFELEDTQFIVDFNFITLPPFSRTYDEKGFIPYQTKLKSITFETQGLYLSIKDFILENDKFRTNQKNYVKKLTNEEIWEMEKSSYEDIIKTLEKKNIDRKIDIKSKGKF
jgi:uncharacterized membrane protein